MKRINSMIELSAGKSAVLAPAILIASKSLIAWAWGDRDYPTGVKLSVSECCGTAEPSLASLNVKCNFTKRVLVVSNGT